jgi:hypothetical protein
MKASRSWFVLVFVLSWSSGARAKEEFPGQIARHLGAQSNPPCGLCHQYAKTGGDTLVTPFAWGMRARGLTGEGDLIGALDRVRTDKVDSDGDGTTDTDEIVAGSDPNSAASTPTSPGAVGDPQLGCAISPTKVPRDPGIGFAWLAAASIWLWRSGRRQPRPV